MAKLIAKELGLNYLDTGALYRAVAIALRDARIEQEDGDEKFKDILSRTLVTFNEGKFSLTAGISQNHIRSKEIDHYSSVFSARKIVRDFLLDAQRNAALSSDLVVEGRDTTTVVFPDAKKKIFLDASVEERAKRRYLQFRRSGMDINIEEAKNNIIERDKRDAGRDIAPLTIAPDALVVDSSELSIEQVKKKIIDFIEADH